MPSLQTLPVELRQRIYGLVLERGEVIQLENYLIANTLPGIAGVAPKGHHRDVAHRGQIRDASGSAWVPAVSDVALILVSNEVNVDVTPLLYGNNRFELQHTGALERFLAQIGDAKQYLHHISIAMGGYKFHDGLAAANRSFLALKKAKDLRSITISHFDLCCLKFNKTGWLDVDDLVNGITPLLMELHVAYEARNVKGNVLDVVKITLPPCKGCWACDHSGGQWVRDRRRVSGKKMSCECFCVAAETNNEALLRDFRRKIAAKLGITMV